MAQFCLLGYRELKFCIWSCRGGRDWDTGTIQWGRVKKKDWERLGPKPFTIHNKVHKFVCHFLSCEPLKQINVHLQPLDTGCICLTVAQPGSAVYESWTGTFTRKKAQIKGKYEKQHNFVWQKYVFFFYASMHSYAVNHLAKPLLHLSTPFEDPQNFLYSE